MSFLLQRRTSPTENAPSLTDEQFRRPWGVLLDDQLQRSARRAWQVAWCAVFIAILAVSGIIALAPYRRIVPFLLAMDRVSGEIFPIGAVDNRTIKGYQELLDKHWVQRYVVARESYFYRLLQEDYDTVCEMSEDEEKEKFVAEYEGPAARDTRLGDRTEITVKISSVQLSSTPVGTEATVRFSTMLRHLDTGAPEALRYHIVTIAYRYKPSMFGSELQLVRNPLGFKAGPYRRSEELAPTETGTVRSRPAGA